MPAGLKAAAGNLGFSVREKVGLLQYAATSTEYLAMVPICFFIRNMTRESNKPQV
jgi:hypothetical protein